MRYGLGLRDFLASAFSLKAVSTIYISGSLDIVEFVSRQHNLPSCSVEEEPLTLHLVRSSSVL